MTSNLINTDFDRRRDWITSAAVSANGSCDLECVQSELTASAIASQRIFDIEYDRIT